MPRRILIVQGHPDPDQGRLCRALADAYADGAAAAGHTVERIDLAALDVPFLRTQDEFGQPLMLPDLVRTQQAIMAADHLVLLFPLWLGTMPALVKAFLEQVLRPGFAFQYQANGLPRRLLTGKSARVVVTMGMPALAYRWWYGAHGVRGLERNILAFVGFGPIRRTLIGGIAGLGPSGGRARCEEMRALGRRAL